MRITVVIQVDDKHRNRGRGKRLRVIQLFVRLQFGRKFLPKHNETGNNYVRGCSSEVLQAVSVVNVKRQTRYVALERLPAFMKYSLPCTVAVMVSACECACIVNY